MIAVTGTGDIVAAVRAFNAGAIDFLYKPYEIVPLMAAIDRAFYLLDHGVEEPQAAALARQAMARLSRPEAEILGLLIRGHGNPQIGEAMASDERSVRVLLARMMDTLEAPSLLAAIRIAMTAGRFAN